MAHKCAPRIETKAKLPALALPLLKSRRIEETIKARDPTDFSQIEIQI